MTVLPTRRPDLSSKMLEREIKDSDFTGNPAWCLHTRKPRTSNVPQAETTMRSSVCIESTWAVYTRSP